MAPAAVNGGEQASSKQQFRSSSSGKNLDAPRKQSASPNDSQNKKQQPKAWQGVNPITQRATFGVANGTEKPLPKLPQHSLPKTSTDSHAERHAHDRATYFIAQFVGNDAKITLRNGEQFTGVFSGASLDRSKTQYVLKMVRRVRMPNNQEANGDKKPPYECIGEGEDYAMSFDVQDTVELTVPNVSIEPASSHQNGSIRSSFLTDAQISSRDGHALGEGRLLEKWQAPEASVDMFLGNSTDAQWDQFAVNERMYNVQSTYDEDIYTTRIDRNNPGYKRIEARADKIAREIEGSQPANAHVAEERRRDASDRDEEGDEEDKYSGVRRDTSAANRDIVNLPKRAANAYVPPGQRPMTGAPTVPGAPFDPAIISAHISKPISNPPMAAVGSPTPLALNQEVVGKDSVQASTLASIAAAAAAGATAATSAQTFAKKENTTEDRVRDTADAFKQFANNEKLRIRAAQEAKRAGAKQEKNVKLNDLKKFAANFKLKSRVPDDLVPILAKDPGKQAEIQHKAEEAAKAEETKSKEKSEKGSTAASPPPPQPPSQVGPSAAADQRAPFNSRDSRTRMSQQPRAPLSPGGHLGPSASRQLPNARVPSHQLAGRPGMPQPLLPDLRIPPGPSVSPPADKPMSPVSATRLNVNAKSFEFRPGAHTFTPTGTSPSPQRNASNVVGYSSADPTSSFFEKTKSVDSEQSIVLFNAVQRMSGSDYNEHDIKKYRVNGALPQAYNTIPTWFAVKANDAASYTSLFPKVQAMQTGQGPSPVPTTNHNGQMTHHFQGTVPPQNMPTPGQQRPHVHYFAQPQHGHGPSFQQPFGPNGSVHNSPRPPQHMPAAPFGAQMPPMPAQPFPQQPIPYPGMSPGMQYRQPNLPPGGIMMSGQHGGHMMALPPAFPAGPPFRGTQMGGHMMVQQHSGGYPGGPMPQQAYSPMPPHQQPHLPHVQQGGGPSGYSGSPRPPVMQHQGSHQGFQPQMQQPHFMASNGQHPYHMQHRAMSGGYPQMTPRQQHSMPNHPSPAMGMGVSTQGDEGR